MNKDVGDVMMSRKGLELVKGLPLRELQSGVASEHPRAAISKHQIWKIGEARP